LSHYHRLMPATILVVDDSVDTRDLIHLYLTGVGYTVLTAADGGEGLYRAKAERPDLIITDINMPNLDGHALVRELRAEGSFAGTPIVALTAYGSEAAEEAKKNGADAVFAKPMNFDELLAEVARLLASRGPVER
jgi:two-component system chemotaxis response regulator CheY